jgi:hypothetical protein
MYIREEPSRGSLKQPGLGPSFKYIYLHMAISLDESETQKTNLLF